MERLDKLLSRLGFGSRSEVKKIIKKGAVKINGAAAASADIQVSEKDIVTLNGEKLNTSRFIYIMMNKPAGIVSSTESGDKTVLDILDASLKRKGLFPAGRLDKDTEGLIIITDDGEFAHKFLSPKNHVPKTYYVEVEGVLDEEDIAAFKKGITLKNDEETKPAVLEIAESAAVSKCYLTICEGKYHQVKRMMAARGKEVVYLKRVAIGGLKLDESLASGQSRILTDEERALIFK